jgi:hypothetical protein
MVYIFQGQMVEISGGELFGGSQEAATISPEATDGLEARRDGLLTLLVQVFADV